MRRDLDISLIRAFLAVVDADGVTAAASVLGVSQAAASQQIKRLEEALDCRLFERRGRKLALAPAGERLLAQAPAPSCGPGARTGGSRAPPPAA